MTRRNVMAIAAVTVVAPTAHAQSDGPYKVLQRARVGGEGGTDYITADPVNRRLYIPRGATREVAATDSAKAVPAAPARITVFNLDNLAPLGEMLTAPNSQGNGVAIDAKSGHGFSSSRPALTMFDIRTMQLMKSIPIDSGFGPDGIYFDDYNDRVNVFSHPTKSAMVDVKNRVLFAACAQSGNPPVQPPEPKMVVLSATDGKILATLPLAGGSDGATFNPETMEAFSTHGNGTFTVVREKSPTSFEVE